MTGHERGYVASVGGFPGEHHMSFFKNLKTGQLVQLKAQDEKSVCHFTIGAGTKVHELPSHEFFAQYDAATPDEIEDAKPKKETKPAA